MMKHSIGLVFLLVVWCDPNEAFIDIDGLIEHGVTEHVFSFEESMGELSVANAALKAERIKLESLSSEIEFYILFESEIMTNQCKVFEQSKIDIMNEMANLQTTIGHQMNITQQSCLESAQDFTELFDTQKMTFELSFQSLNDQINYMVTSAQTSRRPKDCSEAKQFGYHSGVTKIYLNEESDEVEVFCDQDTDGGGWMAILKRQEQQDQLSFQQQWSPYVDGFGEPSGEYWLGLKFQHAITTESPQELLVTMVSGAEEAKSYYGLFRVGSSSDEYKLSVGGYNELKSTGGDSLSYHNGMHFTTVNSDNDMASGGSCAEWSGSGGWWFNYCYMTNPTGLYGGSVSRTYESDSYLEWRNWQGYYAYLSDFSLLIRPAK